MPHVLDLVMKPEFEVPSTLELLENLSKVFSRMIDFRSSFTASHSQGVGAVAYAIAYQLGLDPVKCQKIKIAGLLHDIGKIGIPTEIIEKPGGLNRDELLQMKSHSYYTHMILGEIKGMEDIALWASAHHEKHDGSGYPFHYESEGLSLETDIIAFADIFTALAEVRPYRAGLDKDKILQIMKKDLLNGHNRVVYQVVESHFESIEAIRIASQIVAEQDYSVSV